MIALAVDRVLVLRLILGGVIMFICLCAALALGPPLHLRRCRCRSYHRRTGEHAVGCPRRR